MTTPGIASVEDAHSGPNASTGILTLWLKGGTHLSFRRTSVATLSSMHSHLKAGGFSGWMICVFSDQTLAVNMAEVTAIHFDAHPGRVRLVE